MKQKINDNSIEVNCNRDNIKMEEQTDTTVMIEADAPATIFEDISLAIDNWLEKISHLEERQNQLGGLQEKVYKSLKRVKENGSVSAYDYDRLRQIGDIWIDLINSFSTARRNKRLIVKNLLRLYDLEEISIGLFIEAVVQL